MNKKLYLLVFALACFSCNKQEKPNANNNLLYFDLKGYFEKEIDRLQEVSPSINKTVSINGAKEQKTLTITDWQKELAIFQNADINKNSWRGSFKITKQGEQSIYSSDNRKIPIKKILVEQQGSKVSKISIIVNNNNILYRSQDTLTYIPDSLYEIKKQQKIRFLAQKNYLIIGKFN